MAILGLVLLVAAVAVTTGVIMENTTDVGVDLWGFHISNASLGYVFAAGVATGLIALLGLVLLVGGLKRSTRIRRERRALTAENRRLAEQVSPPTPEHDIPAQPPYVTGAADETVHQPTTSERRRQAEPDASSPPAWREPASRDPQHTTPGS